MNLDKVRSWAKYEGRKVTVPFAANKRKLGHDAEEGITSGTDSGSSRPSNDRNGEHTSSSRQSSATLIHDQLNVDGNANRPAQSAEFKQRKKAQQKEFKEKEKAKKKEERKKWEQHIDKSIWGQFKAAILSSYVNLLLVFVPVGIALHFTSVSPIVVFVMNFLAIIPLAGTLSYATEEIALRTGETLGGLLNASFG
jgi:Ca2+:H+ antiporter